MLLGHANWLTSAVFSAEDKTVLTASDDKTARIWSVFTTHVLVREGSKRVPRCLTKKQRTLDFSLDPEPTAWCRERELWPYAEVKAED